MWQKLKEKQELFIKLKESRKKQKTKLISMRILRKSRRTNITLKDKGLLIKKTKTIKGKIPIISMLNDAFVYHSFVCLCVNYQICVNYQYQICVKYQICIKYENILNDIKKTVLIN